MSIYLRDLWFRTVRDQLHLTMKIIGKNVVNRRSGIGATDDARRD